MIPVRLTGRERDLVLTRTFRRGEVDQRIRTAATAGAPITLRLAADDLEDLVGRVAAPANHCVNAVLQRQLDRLHERLARS